MVLALDRVYDGMQRLVIACIHLLLDTIAHSISNAPGTSHQSVPAPRPMHISPHSIRPTSSPMKFTFGLHIDAFTHRHAYEQG